MEVVEYRLKQSPTALQESVVIEYLQEVIKRGSGLAGVRDTPYGVGPIGAICAPVVMAQVAKARQMLDQQSIVEAEIARKNKPWLKRILDPQFDGTLARMLHDEATTEKNQEDQKTRRGPYEIETRFDVPVGGRKPETLEGRSFAQCCRGADRQTVRRLDDNNHSDRMSYL